MGKELFSIGNVTKVIFERESRLSFQRKGIDELQRIRVKLDLDEVINHGILCCAMPLFHDKLGVYCLVGSDIKG